MYQTTYSMCWIKGVAVFQVFTVWFFLFWSTKTWTAKMPDHQRNFQIAACSTSTTCLEPSSSKTFLDITSWKSKAISMSWYLAIGWGPGSFLSYEKIPLLIMYGSQIFHNFVVVICPAPHFFWWNTLILLCHTIQNSITYAVLQKSIELCKSTEYWIMSLISNQQKNCFTVPLYPAPALVKTGKTSTKYTVNEHHLKIWG